MKHLPNISHDIHWVIKTIISLGYSNDYSHGNYESWMHEEVSDINNAK